MRRVAFKMKLFKGCCEEYKKRHDAIWPELCRELKAAGISDYSIFLDEETLTLFAVQKLTDANSADSLPEKEIMKKWWDHMADIMETKPNQSPVCTELREVFYLN